MEVIGKSNDQINELHLNLHGKVLFSAIASWLMGREVNLQVKGTKEQIRSLARTMNALRDFQDEMEKPNADAKTVMKKLGIKNSEIKQFERTFGIKWPSQL